LTVSVTVKPRELSLLSRSLSPSQAEEILDGLGAVLLSRFQKSFREGKSPNGTTWPARMTPNVAGIVKDLNAGGNPKARRFSPGQTLVDTGVLRGSLTWAVEGKTLKVGTSVSYAGTQNDGGESSITLTAAGRSKLTTWLRTLPKERRKTLGIGWLFNKPTFAIKVRKRTFVEIGAGENKVIRDFVAEEVVRIIRG